jgi:ectoine hydroxylase-related dioxygenase (phytanoyl-CoA dioxygenase family)
VVVSAADIEAFWRDGAVCLRGAMPERWLEQMAEPVEATLHDPGTTDLSAFGEQMRDAAGAQILIDGDVVRRHVGRGHFHAGTDHWKERVEFKDFAFDSPLPAIVAALLRSSKVYFYEDSVLVKEPGTQERTAFHQDMAYFHVEGTQVCTTWVPLDPVTEATGAVQFVRGSHRWTRQFRPNMFVTTMPLPDTDGEEVPDYFRDRENWDIVTWDLQPGDITVHHARTIHGASGNASATQRRRAISVRYCGDDAVYRIKRGAPLKPHHADVRDGDPLEHPMCPLVYRAG